MPTLQMAKHTFHGDGRCVFCMKAFEAAELTDEHIIPEAIHGSLVIENGSCRTCAQHSNQNYENPALNGDLQLARVLLGLKGKRGSAAPKDVRHLPPVYQGDVHMGGERVRILNFPVSHYPKLFHLQRFPAAGFLEEIDRGGNLAEWRLQTFNVGGPSLDDVTVSLSFTNGIFAKMIAKIGYCYATARLGLDGFNGSDIRSLLRDERDDVYNFVGCAMNETGLTNRHLHGLYLRQRGEWTTVLVHLFASLSTEPKGAIPYEVVVGKRI